MCSPPPEGGWASVKRGETWRRTRRPWQRRLRLSVLAQSPSTDRWHRPPVSGGRSHLNHGIPTLLHGSMELNDMIDWQSEQRSRNERLDAGSKFAEGKMVAPGKVTALLEAVVRPGDRICLEGDNQKQADFLAACLANADPKVLHDLHVVQSGIVLPEHIDLFEKGIAKKLDFSYSGPQSHAVPRVLKSGKVELGAIHTYVELFARYFVGLTPLVALTVARSADRAR